LGKKKGKKQKHLKPIDRVVLFLRQEQEMIKQEEERKR
jgi:hypothetical protein